MSIESCDYAAVGVDWQCAYVTHLHCVYIYNIDGLVREGRGSSALAMELRLSCVSPAMYATIRSISSSYECMRMFLISVFKYLHL